MIEVAKILKQLPYEAKTQIIDVYCVDNNKQVEDLTLEEIVDEIKWTIEKIEMDIEDGADKRRCNPIIKKCQKVLNML